MLGDRYWIYPTYSDRYEKQTHFDAFSSPDLVTWTKHPRILAADDVSWANRAVWAPSAVEKGGKYYLFFGANDIQSDDAVGGIGVAVADAPEGPYKDLLGEPLIGEFHNGAQPIDQFVFRAPDGTDYLLYGGWRRCNIAKLNDDYTGFVPFADGTTFARDHPGPVRRGPVHVRAGRDVLFHVERGRLDRPELQRGLRRLGRPVRPVGAAGHGAAAGPGGRHPGPGHHSVVNVPGTDEWFAVYHRRPLGETDRDHRVTCIDRMTFAPRRPHRADHDHLRGRRGPPRSGGDGGGGRRVTPSAAPRPGAGRRYLRPVPAPDRTARMTAPPARRPRAHRRARLPATAKRGGPNLLVLFSDDQGVNDVGCYGSEIPTPHLDSLAAGGADVHAVLRRQQHLHAVPVRAADRPLRPPVRRRPDRGV